MTEVQIGSDVTATQTPDGVEFHKIDAPAPQGQAFVPTERTLTQRELEMAAGARRVAAAKFAEQHRPPRIKSENELRAEGSTVQVFRPNSVYADRVVGHNGGAVSQQLGAMMRRVGGAKPLPAAT